MNFLSNLFSRKKGDEEIRNCIAESGSEYISILNNIEILLNKENHNAQAKFVSETNTDLQNKRYDDFISKLNSVNFWGGSGAIWEVYFDNKNNEKQFAAEVLKLIELMEKTAIAKSYTKQLKKVFRREIK